MITLDREVKFAEHKLIKLVKPIGNSESLFFFFSLAIALFSGSERVNAEGQGLQRVQENLWKIETYLILVPLFLK